jgi:hypothetical protein
MGLVIGQDGVVENGTPEWGATLFGSVEAGYYPSWWKHKT